MKEKMINWISSKFKTSTLHQKTFLGDCEKIIVMHVLDIRVVSTIYEELFNQIKGEGEKAAFNMGKIFFKGTIENIWMTNKLMSICSTLLNSRKIKKKKE